MRARVERRERDARAPTRHAQVTPQHARATHERGTRRARACIAWMTLGLMTLCAAPRAWYASYIDVFGERGGQSIGDRIEARIRAREAAREAARAAAMEARGRRGFGWFGGARGAAARADDGGSARRGGANDAMEMVATRETKARDERGDGSREARAPTDERETQLLESLQERLRKANDERDSIIYLVRKIQGKSPDGDQVKTELTEEEIDGLTERLALASESKSLLKKIGLGR